MAESAAFVLCIENNAIRNQALLLIESIRTFAGELRHADIFAVAPRPGLGVDQSVRARLEALHVHYYEAPLNTVCPEYGSANRVYSAAWAAQNTTATTLIVLDSDTLFLNEPELLGADTDVAVRPVDKKGSTTCGIGDEFEAYWQALCTLAGVSIDILPFVETTIDRRQVRASYNGGYAVVRRETGILELAADLFSRSVEADIRPFKSREGFRVRASTGYVSERSSQYWGSNQAAFAIAAWSLTKRIRLLDARYNVPLHLLAKPDSRMNEWDRIGPIHVHYHRALDAEHRTHGLEVLARLGVPANQLDWIAARTPLAAPSADH